MPRERVYQLFEEYFNKSPLLQVWEVGDDIVYGSKQEIGYKLLTEVDPVQLLSDARTDTKAFELFHQGMIHALRNNLQIPIPAQQLLAEYLDNPKTRPKGKPGPKTDFEFNWRLRVSLLELESEGITPTRNPATDPDNVTCGVDVVLDVLCEFDQSNEYTYENLAKRYFETLKKFPKRPE